MSETPREPRIVRTFYANGSPKEETHYLGSSCHGPWRQWHPNGVLATEVFYEMHVFADGVHRHWFPNGQLQREFTTRNADIISDRAFNSRGKPIPSPLEAHVLRMQQTVEKAIAKGRLAKRAPKAKESDRNDSFAQMLLATEYRSALNWLNESSDRQLGEMDHALSKRLVEGALELGASDVVAVKVETIPGTDSQTSNHILIELPQDHAARARLFAFKRVYAQSQGFDGSGDCGQKYLYLKLC